MLRIPLIFTTNFFHFIFLIAFSSILENFQCLGSTSTIFGLVQSKIHQNHPFCSALTLIIDSNLFYSGNRSDFSDTFSREIRDFPVSLFILKLDPDLFRANQTDAEQNLEKKELLLVLKYHQSCSLIMAKVSIESEENSNSDQEPPEENDEDEEDEKQYQTHHLPIKIPGKINYQFYLFTVEKCGSGKGLSIFLRKTRWTLHMLIICPEWDENLVQIDLFARGLSQMRSSEPRLVKIGRIKIPVPEFRKNPDERKNRSLMFYKEIEPPKPGEKNVDIYTSEKYVDFNGSPLNAQVCAVCEKMYTVFKETGNWYDYPIASMYELSLLFNSTLELSAVFSEPRTSADAYGNYDDFISPLLTGSASMTAVILPSIEFLKLTYVSRTIYHDSVGFITARPTKKSLTSLSVFIQPLKPLVWIFFLLTILFILCALTVMLTFFEEKIKPKFPPKRKRQVSKSDDLHYNTHLSYNNSQRMYQSPWANGPDQSVGTGLGWGLNYEWRRWSMTSNLNMFLQTPDSNSRTKAKANLPSPLDILLALTETILDQAGIISIIYNKICTDSRSRFIIGLWYLSLIVLSCGYKSKQVALMVLPIYDHPPTTFEQLITANYEIGALFFTGSIGRSFSLLEDASLHNSKNRWLSRQIRLRVKEMMYYEPDCYQMLFERSETGQLRACVGFKDLFDALGIYFIVDANMEKMVQKSSDSFFPQGSGIGVSHFYPTMLEPMNFLIRSLDSTGFFIFWFRNAQRAGRKLGQQNARNWVKNGKLEYKGEEQDERSTGRQFSFLGIKLLQLGLCLSAIGFLLEQLWEFRKKTQRRRNFGIQSEFYDNPNFRIQVRPIM